MNNFNRVLILMLGATLSVMALFASPAIATVGDLIEADFNGGAIFKFVPAGSRSTFTAGLNGPEGMAFDSRGNFYVTETGTGIIFRFTPDGTRTTFASGLNGPASLVFDGGGNLFDADFFGGIIYKFAPDGTRTTFASGLNGPANLIFDAAGNLFEADFQSGTIFKFTPAGARTTFATGVGNPHGLAFDRDGNLFVANFGGGIIYRFTPAASRTTFATGLNGPHGLVFDQAGNLFEADYNSGIIYKFTPAGTRTVFASGLSAPANLIFEPATSLPLNISTRLRVLTGDNVLIGGFIITGSGTKRVMLRAIGPSLTAVAGISDALQDPVLELRASATGTVVRSNDNWMLDQRDEIQQSGIAPSDSRESALIASIPPGAYTATLRGSGDKTGVAVVEVYDLDGAVNSKLANISTRGLVATGDNVMIGGFILGSGNGMGKVLVRAIGPTLTQFGIANALPNPMLELRDVNGAVLASNDDWRERQATEIQATGIPPASDLESALIATIPVGNFTAIVSGSGTDTGVALVEAYSLQ